MDSEKERTMPTANAEDIQKNIDGIISEFSLHLRSTTIVELKKLRNMHAACLANIPVKVGTQKNEGQVN